MPLRDNKFVGHSYLVNKNLKKIIEDENKTKTGNNNKIQWKSARGKCRSNLNRKFFTENFIYDPLNVFPKPMGTIINRIM